MKEIFDYILSLFKSRIFPLIMVFIVLVGVLVNRLFSLQIINGESYVKRFIKFNTKGHECCCHERKNIR